MLGSSHSKLRTRTFRPPPRWWGIRWALGLALLVPAGPLAAQGSVSGTVIAEGSLRPLPGAQVVVQGTGAGTLTDARGRFLLTGLTGVDVSLQVRMLGYRPVERMVRVGDTNVRIALAETAIELDEVVVTGTAGGQQVRAIGNAVGQLKADELQQIAPSPNVESLLSGQISGVQVAQGSGEIGGGSNIVIRGAGSMSLSSQPLLYVDGVRVNNNNADFGGGPCGVGVDCGIPPSRLNDINPEDIESVEIIKGPAASTLYGTEASNGVINIVTKKGNLGAPLFTFTMKQGANWLPNPEELFPATYFRCRGTSGTCTPGEVVEFNVLREDRIRHGHEWFQTGHAQGYNASVNGGGEDVTYYFSLDWDRDEGPVEYNWQNKLNGRANLNWTPSEKINLDFGLGAIDSRLESASAQQPLTTAIIWACPAPGCEEGSGLPNAVDGKYRGYIAYLPERYENDIEGFQDVGRFTYSLTAQHRPTSFFTHRFTAGADFTNTSNSELYRPLSPGEVGHFQPRGQKSVLEQHTRYLSADYSATATLDVGEDFNFATSTGLQYYQKSNGWLYAQGRIFPVRQLETVTAGADKTASEDFWENKTFGAYLQEQVSWRNRLFLTGAVRGDDNSAFGQNFDFVVYPKVSASYVVSDEPFFADRLGFLNTLKLRSAWGKAGQQPDVFAALRTFQPATGIGGTPTLTPENLGNPDLEPEVGTELELGFDAGLLDDRISLEFTYYDQSTENAIVQVPVLPSVGFPGFQFRNLGAVGNRGVEVGVDAGLYRAEKVGFDLGFIFSRNENEILDLGGLGPQVVSGFTGQVHVEGFPLATMFRKRVVSAEIEGSGPEAKAVNLMCEGGTIVPGSGNLSRGGGAPVPCAEAPRVAWGTPVPTTQASLVGTLTLFRDLRLLAQADYVGGHHMIDGNAFGTHVFFLQSQAILDRTDPILLGYEALGSEGGAQTGLFDASFAKLRRVSLSYNLPNRMVTPFGGERASLTLTAYNVATLYQAQDENFGYPVIDPEVRVTIPTSTAPGGFSAYHQEGWPQLRRFLATVRVTF